MREDEESTLLGAHVSSSVSAGVLEPGGVGAGLEQWWLELSVGLQSVTLPTVQDCGKATRIKSIYFVS